MRVHGLVPGCIDWQLRDYVRRYYYALEVLWTDARCPQCRSMHDVEYNKITSKGDTDS